MWSQARESLGTFPLDLTDDSEPPFRRQVQKRCVWLVSVGQVRDVLSLMSGTSTSTWKRHSNGVDAGESCGSHHSDTRGALHPAMETVLPWLQRRSQKLMDMERETLMEILQNCSYEKAAKDDIIVKQGEKGDKFYIIISGRTSVYIDVTKSDDDPFEERGYQRPKLLVKSAQSDAALEHAGKGAKRNKTSSRDVLGKFISHLETGKTFGEIALLSTDAIRNATVVADEDTDLLVINRILFNRCVKAKEEAIYKEKVEFVSQHKLFRSWSVKLRRLLEMSLKKEVCPQGTVLMRQGQPPPGLIFILSSYISYNLLYVASGVAQVCMEPLHHEEQFPELWAPVGSVRSKNQVPSGWRPGSTRNKTTPQVAVRRRQGYAAAERRMMGRRVNLCCVGPNDILGAHPSTLSSRIGQNYAN
ncbi:hypothetical protein C0Q70_13274 [Pomacea canaliculata]|uniref:Cyclic nucleotide-binding domain-containing protein n=1 Tax=Pomacea canaliculata TaxID=400727 RepID=A0A2T7NWR8_POMCA|nr:hypothetical protein C0Q70_13274 [Pomacea canaliculata]